MFKVANFPEKGDRTTVSGVADVRQKNYSLNRVTQPAFYHEGR